MGWQVIAVDGTFGICVELTESPNFILSYDYHMDPTVQPYYSLRYGPNMNTKEGIDQRLQFHVQASHEPPSFYKNGLKELVVFRGATFIADYTRPWLYMIKEYCKHLFVRPHVILMRTTTNKTTLQQGRVTRCST